MAIAIDGSVAPDTLKAMPCGGVPIFDNVSGYSYRCDKCFCTIDSIGMPKNCLDALDESRKNSSVEYI